MDACGPGMNKEIEDATILCCLDVPVVDRVLGTRVW
jgi:hypothetical protein